MSYKMFWHPIHRTVLSRLKYASNTSTYLYRFDVDSKFFNCLRILLCGQKIRGTCHGDDLSYLFLNVWSPVLTLDCPEYNAIQEIIGSFTTFAKYGNPNNIENNQIFKSNINWEQCKNLDNSMFCLNYNFDTKFIQLPEYEKNKLWDSFYPEEVLI